MIFTLLYNIGENFMTEHMKVRGIKPRIQYIANGTSKKYEFPFVIFKTSDINVYFDDVLQDVSTYTVSEPKNSLGGAVTFEIAPEKDVIITICRILSIERTTDFQPGTSLRADVLNDEFDYQIACQQELAEKLNRSMVLPAYYQKLDEELNLPLPSAGKAIIWNKAGTNLENSTISVNELEGTINGYRQQAQTAANTAVEQANISVSKALEATEAANQLSGIKANCITKIPQDIKMSLMDGVLTIKAGSNFYYPDGAGVFNKVSNLSDLTVSVGAATGKRMLFIAINKTGTSASVLPGINGTNVFSGETSPTLSVSTAYWYDTKNNVIKRTQDTGNSWGAIPGLQICFPVASVTFDGGICSSVDQVFNGVGYLGTTLFALPGLEVLVANGRNSDGTLNNTKIKIADLKTIDVNTTNREETYLCCSRSGSLGVSSVISTGNAYYDECKNLFFANSQDTGGNHTPIGIYSIQNNLPSVDVMTTFHPVNHNELSGYLLNSKGIRTVVKTYTSDTSWYRIWSDGWIEQGGIETALTYTSTGIVNFLYPFATTNYVITTSDNRASAQNSQGHFNLNNKSTTGFNWNLIATETDFVNTLNWYACGK